MFVCLVQLNTLSICLQTCSAYLVLEISCLMVKDDVSLCKKPPPSSFHLILHIGSKWIPNFKFSGRTRTPYTIWKLKELCKMITNTNYLIPLWCPKIFLTTNYVWSNIRSLKFLLIFALWHPFVFRYFNTFYIHSALLLKH